MTQLAVSPFISFSKSAGLVLSPQSNRCLPKSQMSPGLVIGSAGASSSKLSSWTSSLKPSNSSISSASKPVISFKSSSKFLSSSLSLGKSHSPLILFRAMFKAFSRSGESPPQILLSQCLPAPIRFSPVVTRDEHIAPFVHQQRCHQVKFINGFQ